MISQVTGQQTIEIFPESESDFFTKVMDAQLTFQLGDKGPAKGVMLHQGGGDTLAPRVE